jgi:hypothetical protein
LVYQCQKKYRDNKWLNLFDDKKLLLSNPDLSLALLYSFNLLNGIRFLKDFRVAKPQRGSWQSQRRGRVASPVMIGAD